MTAYKQLLPMVREHLKKEALEAVTKGT